MTKTAWILEAAAGVFPTVPEYLATSGVIVLVLTALRHCFPGQMIIVPQSLISRSRHETDKIRSGSEEA